MHLRLNPLVVRARNQVDPVDLGVGQARRDRSFNIILKLIAKSVGILPRIRIGSNLARQQFILPLIGHMLIILFFLNIMLHK
jgi:hypothetical protein